MLNKNSIQPLYKQLMDIITGQLKMAHISLERKSPQSRNWLSFTRSAESQCGVL